MRILLALFMLALCSQSGRAQMMTHFGPQNMLTSLADSTAPQPVPPRSDFVLKHLPNGVQGFRLVGEIDSSEWPLYLSPQQANGAARVRIGFISAVSVMPEASVLSVMLNDQAVGKTHIRAAGNVRIIEFDIPKGMLMAGFNALRISVDQRHRVDCSLGATYELWTQIDPSQTGLVINRAAATIDNIEDVGALLPDAQGALPVRMVLPPRTSPANIERNLRAVQLLALKGRFEQTATDVGALADGDFGVNLIVGTQRDIAAIDGMPALNMNGGEGVYLVPAGEGRRATLIITGASEDDVNRAFENLTHINEVKGHSAGVRAALAFPGYRATPPQQISLRRLGLMSREFSGRFYRGAFNIIMPADFYPADYGRAHIALDGGYAAGLASEAQILVTTNGKNASSITLPKSGGDILNKSEIPLGLGMLRPGLNRIEIQALLPTEDDRSCDALRALSGDKRFLFLDTSEIIFPPVAHIGRLPDLSVTASGGFPYAQPHLQSMLYLPAPDRNSIAAAATMAARLAVSAGQVIDFRLVTKMPPAGSGALLVIGTHAAVGSDMALEQKDISARLDKIWRERSRNREGNDDRLSRYESIARNRLVLQKNFPAACHMPKPAQGYVAASREVTKSAPQDNAPMASQQMFLEWQQSLHKKSVFYSFEQAAAHIKSYAQGMSQSIQHHLHMALNDAPDMDQVITDRSSLVIVQSLRGPSQDDLVTFVSAPNSYDLSDSMTCLVDPRVWWQMDGQIISLDATEGRLTIVPAQQQKLVATQPFSIANMRLVAASWMTSHKIYYVSLSLFVALLLGCTTGWFVTHTGRKSQ